MSSIHQALQVSRNLADQALVNLRTHDSLFYSRKCVVLSTQISDRDHCKDILRLARALVLDQQYTHAIHVIGEYAHGEEIELVEVLGKCLEKNKAWEELIEQCFGNEDSEAIRKIRKIVHEQPGNNVAAAEICCLRGKAYFALDNSQAAIVWYEYAREFSAVCIRAIYALEELQGFQDKEGDQTNESRNSWFNSFMELIQKPKADQVLLLPQARKNSEQIKLALVNDVDVRYMHARDLFRKCFFSKAIDEISEYIHRHGIHEGALSLYICSLVAQNLKNELFILSHKLMDSFPESHISWFTIGCYYYCIGKQENARKYFRKCLLLDKSFICALIGIGHSFSAQDEIDQALSAYRHAARLFKNALNPVLFLGMEYLKSNHLIFAEQTFKQAQLINPDDPLLLNEVGVLLYRRNELVEAKNLFVRCIQIIENHGIDKRYWENVYLNLGHVFRKMKDFENALNCFENALIICSTNDQLLMCHICIGMSNHALLRYDQAIDHYHRALVVDATDPIANKLLNEIMRMISYE